MKKLNHIVLAIVILSAAQVCAQSNQPVFRPWVFRSGNTDFSAVLNGPKELIVFDSLGNRKANVLANGNIIGAYVSPDGKKIGFATETEVWIMQIENGQKDLVASGYCEHLHWANNSLSFTFTLSEYSVEKSPAVSNLKFFWADSNGKNLKQIYP